MKLVTFSVQTQLGLFDRLGALIGDRNILDLHAGYAWLLNSEREPEPYRPAQALVPPDMIGFLEGGPTSMEAARKTLRWASSHRDHRKFGALRGIRGEKLVYAPSEIRLKSPVPRPSSLRDFMAFEQHAKQGAARRGETLRPEWYEIPAYYKGNHREIYGPNDVIPWPYYTRRLDFECEIGCVVGLRGKNLDPKTALKHIAGYTILNDFSARDIQKKEMLLRMGPAKGKDFATALGPYLLTADEMPLPGPNTALSVWVNGKKWSTGKYKDCYWNFATTLSHVSQEETIYPGDVLGSGTYYRGCGLDLGRWIRPGDIVELEVEGLGILRNRIGKPGQPQRELRYPRPRKHPRGQLSRTMLSGRQKK